MDVMVKKDNHRYCVVKKGKSVNLYNIWSRKHLLKLPYSKCDVLKKEKKMRKKSLQHDAKVTDSDSNLF